MAAGDKDDHGSGCIPLERLTTTASLVNVAACVQEGNLRLFRDLLADVDASEVDRGIVDQGHSTLLHLIAKSGKTDFFRELVRKHGPNVNPNRPHQTLQKFPIHAAAEDGLFDMVDLLVRFGADINARMEDGTTPLHLLAMRSGASWIGDESERRRAQERFFRAAKIVLGCPGVSVDAKNNLGVVPIYFAVDTGSRQVVELLLDAGACVSVQVDDETVEEMMERNMPEVLKGRSLENNRIIRNTTENELFQLLYDEPYHPGRFRSGWEEVEQNGKKIDVEADNGTHTFLQYCCDQGHDRLVSFLLVKGADPNACCASYQIPPLVLAGYHGYYKIINIFMDISKDSSVKLVVDFCAVDAIKKENVLHKVLKQESKAHVNVEHRDYERCLDLLLDCNLTKPAIKAQDQLGNSPLHMAAQLGRTGAVRQLLSQGANIGSKNFRGETPIAHISSSVMSDFLDECLESEGIASDHQFRITFNYSFLGPPSRGSCDSLLEGETADCEGDVAARWQQQQQHPNEDLPEAEPLWYMAQMEQHRHLLLHPVVASFLCLKWRRIRPYYYANLITYLMFVGCLTAYAIQLNLGRLSVALLYLTAVLLIWLTVREAFQALVSFRRYAFNVENVMEICLIATSYRLLQLSTSDGDETRSLSAVVILLSWAEMVLLLGRHPRLSTNVAMLSRVSRNFALFLTWYVPIIVAFGLAFFVVLRRDGEDRNQHFASPQKSLMKTVVMSLAGELEFEGIDFGHSSNFNKLVFLLFVFFVMLVLINLLNGLAVSDIGEIKKEAEIVSRASRLEIVAFLESMLLGDPFQFLTNFPKWAAGRWLPACDCLRAFYRRKAVRKALGWLVGPTLLFDDLADNRAVFYPNQSVQERGGLPGPDGRRRRRPLQVDDHILRSAKALVVKRQEETDRMGEICTRMRQLEKGILLLAKQQNNIIQQLNS